MVDYLPEDISCIGIVGLSKNAGKTTVLNHLLEGYYEQNRKIGVVSIGVDGEKFDAWSGHAKPEISVYPDVLVATSRLAIEESDARFEIVEKIKDSSIGHEVYLVRTIKGGHVKLTGTPSLHEVDQVLQGFKNSRTEINLIDGAYDRVALANPNISDGMILVVGAAYHRSLTVIIERVRELLFRKRLPTIPDPNIEQLFFRLAKEGAAGWYCTKNMVITRMEYPLQEGWQHSIQGEEGYLLIPGACTSKYLSMLSSLDPVPTLVIQDGTRLFAKWEEIAFFYRRGGSIYTLKPIRLLGIAVNPHSPDGYQFDPDEMLTRVKEISEDLPVFDVVRGKVLI